MSSFKSDDPGTGQRQLIQAILPPALVLGALVIGWALAVALLRVDPSVVPAPQDVISATWADRASLWPAIVASTGVALAGIALAIVVAVALALAVDWSPTIRRSIYPLMVASQTIPIIALAPLVIIWFGFGAWPKVILVALFTFFAVAVGVVQGLASADRDASDLLRTMGASRLDVLRRVRIPSAIPSFFTGLKVATTYAFVATIVAEFVGAEQGLGVYLTASKNALRTDLVFGATLITALLTLLLFGLVVLLERWAMPWRRPTEDQARW